MTEEEELILKAYDAWSRDPNRIEAPECFFRPFNECTKYYFALAERRSGELPISETKIQQHGDLILVQKTVVARSLAAAREEMRK